MPLAAQIESLVLSRETSHYKEQSVKTPNWDDPIFQASSDTEWQARLRALQSWYRENVLQTEAGLDRNQRPRGNLLPAEARRGLNFLTPAIADFVEEWLPSAKETRALIDEDRLWRNLLSSMPLAFNLFVPLRNDLGLASRVFELVSDGRVSRVTGIDFEYSPGRGDIRYTEDGTAFDVYVEFVTESQAKGFIGIEVKYHEDLRSDKAEKRERYSQIAKEMNCFHESRLNQLHDPPLGQIWRNHLLAGSLKIEGPYQEGQFAMVYPSTNLACGQAVEEYQECLTDSRTFQVWHLEQLADAVNQVSSSDWIESFISRYLDFEKTGKAG